MSQISRFHSPSSAPTAVESLRDMDFGFRQSRFDVSREDFLPGRIIFGQQDPGAAGVGGSRRKAVDGLADASGDVREGLVAVPPVGNGLPPSGRA